MNFFLAQEDGANFTNELWTLPWSIIITLSRWESIKSGKIFKSLFFHHQVYFVCGWKVLITSTSRDSRCKHVTLLWCHSTREILKQCGKWQVMEMEIWLQKKYKFLRLPGNKKSQFKRVHHENERCSITGQMIYDPKDFIVLYIWQNGRPYRSAVRLQSVVKVLIFMFPYFPLKTLLIIESHVQRIVLPQITLFTVRAHPKRTSPWVR